MSDFPKCWTFVHPLYGGLNHAKFLNHRPWKRLWTTSVSSIHGQRPWTTLLSSKGDLVSYNLHSYCQWHFIVSLGDSWFNFGPLDVDDPYGWNGVELIFRYPITTKTTSHIGDVIDDVKFVNGLEKLWIPSHKEGGKPSCSNIGPQCYSFWYIDGLAWKDSSLCVCCNPKWYCVIASFLLMKTF